MIRFLSAALLAFAVLSPAVRAQGPLQRAGQALDNAGRNVRRGVESAVARGQITAQERDLLHRVSRRIEWDKPLVGAALRVEVLPGGAVVLRGSVASDDARRRAVDLVEKTVGVTSVVDELAVVRDVQVIEARPAARVIEVTPAAVPGETRVIVKP